MVNPISLTLSFVLESWTWWRCLSHFVAIFLVKKYQSPYYVRGAIILSTAYEVSAYNYTAFRIHLEAFSSVLVHDVNFLRRHDNAFSVCNCLSRLSFLASLSVSSRTNAERRTETGSLEQSSTSSRIDSRGICSYQTTEMTSVRQWCGAGHRRPHVSARQKAAVYFFRSLFCYEKVSCVHAAHWNSHQMALIQLWPIT